MTDNEKKVVGKLFRILLRQGVRVQLGKVIDQLRLSMTLHVDDVTDVLTQEELAILRRAFEVEKEFGTAFLTRGSYRALGGRGPIREKKRSTRPRAVERTTTQAGQDVSEPAASEETPAEEPEDITPTSGVEEPEVLDVPESKGSTREQTAPSGPQKCVRYRQAFCPVVEGVGCPHLHWPFRCDNFVTFDM